MFYAINKYCGVILSFFDLLGPAFDHPLAFINYEFFFHGVKWSRD